MNGKFGIVETEDFCAIKTNGWYTLEWAGSVLSQTDTDLMGLEKVCKGEFCNRVNIILSTFDMKTLSNSVTLDIVLSNQLLLFSNFLFVLEHRLLSQCPMVCDGWLFNIFWCLWCCIFHRL